MKKTENAYSVDRFTLYDTTAEAAMLGKIISNNNFLYDALKHLDPIDLYLDINKKIFSKMVELSQKRQEINLITLTDELGDIEMISSTLSNYYNQAMDIETVEHLAVRLKEYSIKRQMETFLYDKLNGIGIQTADDLIREIGVNISKIHDKQNNENADVKDIIMRVEDQQTETRKRLKSGERFIGMSCGIEKIDMALSGIRRNFYYLVNAYTSTGKTMFSLNVSNTLLSAGKRVVFFSLEMSQEDIVSRILSIRSGINSISIAMGSFSDDESEINAKSELYDMRLRVYSQKRMLDDIILTMISENLKEPVDLFVIDYLQHIRVKGSRSRYDQYTDASNEIQRIIGELGVPVMVLSQIDNISARSKQTDVIATKGSGDVPADADVVILLQNDKSRQDCYKEGFKAVNAIIQKNRHGITGNMELIMETRCGRFHESEKYPIISRDN
jgi:replicative DNA helicase